MDNSKKCLSSEFGRKISLKRKCVNNIVDGADGSFSFTILLRCIRARNFFSDSIGMEMSKKWFVIKFSKVIALKRLDFSFNLYVSMKVTKRHYKLQILHVMETLTKTERNHLKKNVIFENN